MVIIPGEITLELIFGNPAMYMAFLLLMAVFGGLLRGKQESDDAKAGKADKTMENTGLLDWAQDAGLGLAGGIFCLFVAQLSPEVEMLSIFFGYAGRMIVINISRKAEKASEEQKWG